VTATSCSGIIPANQKSQTSQDHGDFVWLDMSRRAGEPNPLKNRLFFSEIESGEKETA